MVRCSDHCASEILKGAACAPACTCVLAHAAELLNAATATARPLTLRKSLRLRGSGMAEISGWGWAPLARRGTPQHRAQARDRRDCGGAAIAGQGQKCVGLMEKDDWSSYAPRVCPPARGPAGAVWYCSDRLVQRLPHGQSYTGARPGGGEG